MDSTQEKHRLEAGDLPGGSATKKKQNRYVCKVAGCEADLRLEKPRNLLVKICDHHQRASQVVVNGEASRYCQQCSCFHGLKNFEIQLRSCRESLQRRRNRRNESCGMPFRSKGDRRRRDLETPSEPTKSDADVEASSSPKEKDPVMESSSEHNDKDSALLKAVTSNGAISAAPFPWEQHMDWIQQRDGSANDTPWSGSSNWQTMDPRQWPYYFGANPWQWVQSQQHLWQEMQRWQWLHAQNSWKSYFEQMHGPSRGVDGQATQPRGQQESCEHDSIPYPQPTGWIQGHFNGRRQHQMQPQDRGASKPWQAPDRAGHSAGQSFVHREGSSDQSS